MLGFLFRRLTAAPAMGAALFDTVTTEARKPHWYVDADIPDTIDGRFAMLATIGALVIVRLEQLGAEGNELSVALTERFIEVMESEHRELGLGDPTLGKTVRKLVGSLARRVALWRDATAGQGQWAEVARRSLYKEDPAMAALRHAANGLSDIWTRLTRAGAESLREGKMQ